MIIGQRFGDFLKREWLFVAILLFVISFSLFKLTEAPPTWYDEGMILQLAMNLSENGVMGIQLAPEVFSSGALISTGFPVIFPLALSFLIFGVSLEAARAVMVFYIASFIIASYFFLHQITEKATALFSIGLIATFSSFYANGKNALGEIPGLLFLVVFLFFTHKIFEKKEQRKINAFLAGLFLGLCVITKPTFLVLGGAALIGIGFSRFYQKQKISLKIVYWAALGWLMPFSIWILTQFSLGDSFSQIISFYSDPYRLQNISSVMWQNFLRFFTESTPIYLAAAISIWTFSILLRMYKRANIYTVEIISFIFCLLIIASYLRMPGWYRYFFPAQIISGIFLPIALFQIFNFFEERIPKIIKAIGPAVILLCLIVLQIKLLVSGSFISTYYKAENTKNLKLAFSSYPEETLFFLYDTPQAAIFLPEGAPYHQYISINAGGYFGIGKEQIPLLKGGEADVVTALFDSLENAPIPENYKRKADIGSISIFERENP